MSETCWILRPLTVVRWDGSQMIVTVLTLAGIYLASEHGKSAGYTHGNGRHAVMFLCEAALGQAFEINADGVIGWRDNDPLTAKKGMSSVLAVGLTEPDPKADIKIKLDKRDVVVPLGKPIANPKLKDHGGHSSFSQSEYLLYKESQVG